MPSTATKMEKIKKPPVAVKEKKIEVNSNQLSDYEKKIQQNVQDRKRMFDMLKLNEAKMELKQAFLGSSTPQTPQQLPLAPSARSNTALGFKPKRLYLLPLCSKPLRF